MRFSLSQLAELARAAGVPDPKGIPLSKVVASIALEESGGDPYAVNEREGSYGLLQIHQADWHTIALETRALMDAPLVSDYARALNEIRVAKPIMEDAARQAMAATKILAGRGFPLSLMDGLLLFDAAWQGPGLTKWAEETTTGYVGEIREGTAPGRTERVRAHLIELGVGNSAKSILTAILAFAGIGLALWFVVEALESAGE